MRLRQNKNTAADIKASFNSDFTPWYLGTDGNTPSTKYDFETVVLHELGHGLGFLSTYTDNSGGGGFGWASGGTTYPTNFDAAEWTAATGGSLLTSFANPSNALGDAVDRRVGLLRRPQRRGRAGPPRATVRARIVAVGLEQLASR